MQQLKLIQNGLRLLFVLSVAILFFASAKTKSLPKETELRTELQDAPSQEEVAERAFFHHWRGENFVLHPVAQYEIFGLVVSRNDIGGFSDIYHTSDSVDVVDVCVIWGENLKESIYNTHEFWSEPFSCWYRQGKGTRAVSNRALSNTHVIASDERLARRLNDIHLGDQIRLRGKLVNYNPAGASEQLRRTSLSRVDTGNGACEVMFVEEYELLKAGNPGWNKLYQGARKVVIVVALMTVLSFLLSPYLEYKFIRK